MQSAPQPLFARAWKVLAARQRWREGQPGGRESKTQVADASERGRWRENKKIQTLLRAKKTLGIPSRFVRVNLAQGPCLSSLCRSRVTPQPLFCAWKVLVVRRRWSEGDPGGGRVRRRCEWKCKGKMVLQKDTDTSARRRCEWKCKGKMVLQKDTDTSARKKIWYTSRFVRVILAQGPC